MSETVARSWLFAGPGCRLAPVGDACSDAVKNVATWTEDQTGDGRDLHSSRIE